MKPLDELLADWREKVRLTKAEAARRCGMSAQLWQQLEGGQSANLYPPTLMKLHQGTGMPLELLMAGAALLRERRQAPVTA